MARFECVLQKDQSDCGAAALATVALHYKVPISVQRMRDLAGTDRVGTNLLGLVQAAEKLGFSARAVKGPYDALKDVALPAIAHWKTEEGFGHFVVFHRWAPDRVVVADPAQGLRKMSREEFSARWTGYLLILAPNDAAGTPCEAGGVRTPWSRFVRLLRPHGGVLAEAFLAAVLMMVLGLAMSYFVQHLVDSVLVRGEWRFLNVLAIGMLAVISFRCLFGILRQDLLVHVSRKVDLGLISRYARHVSGQPLRFFEMRRVGEILSRVHDAVKVREAVSGTTLTTVVDATLVVVSLAVMFFTDWRLALVPGAFIPVFLAAVGAHHPATKKISRRAMEEGAALQAHLVEDASGVETIKAFGAERRRAEAGDDRLVRVIQSIFSLQKLNLSMSTIGMFLTALAGVMVLWIGGHRVIQGALSIGELLFFYTLLGYMLEPLQRLSTVNLQVQDALVAVDRLGEILDLECEKLAEENKAEFRGAKESIVLRDVRFRYGCRSEVLKGLDLAIPAGATVAIVGESGGGKSTLLKLLMRFYEPTEGQILVDGMDLRDFTLASLRARIGLVSQDPLLFTGTIRENIAFGRPEASMEEVVAAAKGAGLEEFIQGLPQRYETVVGERGANLSGGQRQRLAIARVLLTNPEVVVFDEATSHLDTETERAIQANLRNAFRAKTVILVAHRLSTIRDAHLICVLQDGRVAEQGTHEELVSAGGRYAALWRSQSGEEQTIFIDPAEHARLLGDRVRVA